MSFDYNELERQLESSCIDVNRLFHKKYSKNMYLSAGGAKLEAFITELQQEFEVIAQDFIKKNGLEKDADAKRRVFAITKFHAKKCVEGFSRM
ncbi:hypothetical protein [Flavobacterium psychrotrophum]|uniref:hypothetical protein n=1 Tax=Flavobacterium psychrotrophum TaxID=2294119 RepID=UPI000E323EA8|nr:hypothetical protein [Flavobacterium psychrotrophum]